MAKNSTSKTTVSRKITRDALLTRMAEAYWALLNAIGPLLKIEDIEKGIKEGLNKFLSNLCIAIVGKEETDYYSQDALNHLAQGKKHIVYEHMVPKDIYQSEIVDSFKSGNPMTAQDIKDRLEQYWFIATITEAEDKLLSPKKTMPKGWNRTDVLARYGKIRNKMVSRRNISGKGADFIEKVTI